MIVVLAHAEVKQGVAEEFIKAADKCAEATRKEAGSIFYTLYSSTENEQKFVFVEEWETKAALDMHLKTPHLVNFVEQTQDLLTSPLDIKVFEANKI